MRIFATFIILVICSSNIAFATGEREKSECEEIKQKIRYIQSKMRAGYSGKQGEKLNAKLRKLRARRAEVCR